MFEMHWLVQFSMKKWLEQHGAPVGWQERYVDTMYEAFPSGQYENWSKCQALSLFRPTPQQIPLINQSTC
jgi:hypothetical protein